MSAASVVRTVEGLLAADRCAARPLPRVRGAARRAGIAYQINVKKQLRLTVAGKATLESEPWFAFVDKWGRGQAVPDFVILTEYEALIIEVKIAFVPEAIIKLQGLYAPVVGMALGRRTKLLIICKHLIPGVVGVVRSLRSALDLNASVPVLQWLGHGGIEW